MRPPLVRLAPGAEIPRIVNGCWQLAADHHPARPGEKAAVRGLLRLVELGLTAFDCADIYTGVEARLGALHRAWSERGGDPAALRIHTKFVPDLEALPGIDRVYVEAITERSRRRLGVGRLDLVQFHWWDFETPGWVETARWLQDLRLAGRIEHLGLTNFDPAHLLPILEAGVEIVSNQVQYSLLDRRPAGALAALCRERGIAILAYGVLAGGFLSERWLDRPDPGPRPPNRSLVKYRLIVEEAGGWQVLQELLRLLAKVAAKHGVSIANVATHWVLDRPGVAAVILGAPDAAYGEDNLRSFSLELDAEDRAALDTFLATHPGPQGEVYALERTPGGPHAAIMKTGLNRGG